MRSRVTPSFSFHEIGLSIAAPLSVVKVSLGHVAARPASISSAVMMVVTIRVSAGRPTASTSSLSFHWAVRERSPVEPFATVVTVFPPASFQPSKER
ncbi:hypothetical protein [Parabacteroides distasonis]|uniref:hypothetical protein n=1 Tax=Parabacteroides distasonis TaxID=823 RepID=UPI001D08E537|nr:hypothetical protein [Parabacteroides distasonis]MCB6481612.1 hypothetical protein [Parabacteroides distasonis]MCC2778730.1 hypothetical protein [Parabacteroides distasonis]MCI7073711.1 hypothetical protein [Parabacteroides distasonis]